MKKMKKYPHIAILLVTCLLFVIYLLATDPGDVLYKKVRVEHGDSLWSLAAQYRGNMSANDWIQLVKAENELADTRIIAGKSLVVPVVGEAVTTLDVAQK
ncbi:cell division suppressor protein YneA [Lysinibacillus piscis]|uniref:LysM domain-containing protein n=1 Tax=Lysinibacillus piscis TaxID=2518931 RepID=A0ABQ5NHD0_9BACI|nr:LysM peptidoglycan-binding domain-containing protein [Lysinibacillus sp. KH24]GLC87698.1 hypothetical protein LYSBPC_08250 [Lysinibacillus sp. KH24]